MKNAIILVILLLVSACGANAQQLSKEATNVLSYDHPCDQCQSEYWKSLKSKTITLKSFSIQIIQIFQTWENIYDRSKPKNLIGYFHVKVIRNGRDGFIYIPFGLTQEELEKGESGWILIRADQTLKDDITKLGEGQTGKIKNEFKDEIMSAIDKFVISHKKVKKEANKETKKWW